MHSTDYYHLYYDVIRKTIKWPKYYSSTTVCSFQNYPLQTEQKVNIIGSLPHHQNILKNMLNVDWTRKWNTIILIKFPPPVAINTCQDIAVHLLKDATREIWFMDALFASFLSSCRPVHTVRHPQNLLKIMQHSKPELHVLLIKFKLNLNVGSECVHRRWILCLCVVGGWLEENHAHLLWLLASFNMIRFLDVMRQWWKFALMDTAQSKKFEHYNCLKVHS
jgi:hypothetical protein